MNILLVYPKCPDSFWSLNHALKFISKKAAVPPLGLITVSAMLPATWEKKLVDMNVTELSTIDILWADYVFISAMHIQKESVNNIIAECKKWSAKIVAGGPLFTQDFPDYPEIDHFVLNEAEITLPYFLDDLSAGKPQKVYTTEEYADLSKSPVPDFQLLSAKDYAFMNIEVTRGCPFSGNFSEITSLPGHEMRMKSTEQIISELDVLYDRIKWRGPVSVVDDNFIGNMEEVKYNLLPAIIEWMRQRKYPFTFTFESSINLADDEELMLLLVEAGFNATFIGIETLEEKSLNYCNKTQNRNRDLLESVKKIQQSGIQVAGGFIVGFDSDTPTVFQRQIDFIQQSGIVSVMVGLLNTPKNTNPYRQPEAENSLTTDATGNNTDSPMNFIAKMNHNELLEGYHHIIQNIYSTRPYYKRVRQLLLNYNQLCKTQNKISLSLLKAFLHSVFVIGILNKGRREYWKLIFWTIFNRPKLTIDALTCTVYGYHFRTVYGLRNNNNT